MESSRSSYLGFMRDLQPDCSQTYCRRYVSKYSAYCSEPRYAIWLCRRNCPHVHVICAGAKPPGFSGSPARTYSGSRHLHRLKILTCGYATTWIGAERHAGRTRHTEGGNLLPLSAGSPAGIASSGTSVPLPTPSPLGFVLPAAASGRPAGAPLRSGAVSELAQRVGHCAVQLGSARIQS